MAHTQAPPLLFSTHSPATKQHEVKLPLSQGRLALLAFVFLLPIILAQAALWFQAARNGDVFTGLYGGDGPYYMANARSHFADGFSLLYSNPNSADPDSPAIYFQPQHLLLGILAEVFRGIPPGYIFIVYGLVFGWLCLRSCILLFHETVGLRTGTSYLLLTMFLWGGGLLTLAGGLYVLKNGSPLANLFHFDPANGHWFLNFGRNLWYPHEAYYHFLGISIVRLMLKQKYGGMLAVLTLLAASSPYTGMQFICFTVAWCVLERFYFRNRGMPLSVIGGSFAVLALELAYYLFWLPTFPEHKSVMDQWTLKWELDAIHMIPAYALVGVAAVLAHRSFGRSAALLRLPYQRVFLTLFIVSFALANHEAFFKSHQPLHFTRGYVWTSLFFLGLPGLAAGFRWLRARLGRVLGRLCVLGIVSLFLVDNAVWLALRPAYYSRIPFIGVSQGDMDAVYWLRDNRDRDTLVIASTRDIPYLATMYARVRVWFGQLFCTPYASQRIAEATALIQTGKMLPEWGDQEIVVALRPAEVEPFLSAFSQANAGAQAVLLLETPTVSLYALP